MTSVGGVPELRLAVVDDQPLYRHMLSSLLRAVPGVRSVVEAGSATEARSVLRPAELDVAILDIELGDGDGIELGRRLRSTAPGLGIVLLSAVDAMHRFLRLDRAEARGWSYLSKTSSSPPPRCSPPSARRRTAAPCSIRRWSPPARPAATPRSPR
ncbi:MULTISPECIES: response regulator transcription factor [unclassified Rathayibacter]|uniref:response regulator n=1 Tax=unclassified Rathayibacter TaxID=2609250 RepID=UPI0021574D16|nr:MULTISPECIES: response regulator transcription factor [unclassified Rathayibacter]